MERLQIPEEALEEMYREAEKAFRVSESYSGVYDRIEKITIDWKKRYSGEEKAYLEDCLLAYQAYYREEKWFVYRKGIEDAVALLKQLGVLA